LPEARLRERELRLDFLDLQPVGRRVDAKQHLTFFIGRLPSAGTSITMPRTCGLICTT